jgi:hypothetical protein
VLALTGGRSGRRLRPSALALFAALALIGHGPSLSAEAAGAGPGAGEAPASGLARSIGRILTGGTEDGACAGVLVARDRVLTAGHCVMDKRAWRADAAPPTRFLLDGVEYAVDEILLSPSSPFATRGRLELRHDWALLRLVDGPGPRGRPLPYAGADAAQVAFITDEPLVKAGYRKGSRLIVTEDCRPQGREAGSEILLFRCPDEARTGRSGSALLRREREGFSVVAIQSAKAGRTAEDEVGLAISPPVQALARR